jgi:hypothetical protein
MQKNEVVSHIARGSRKVMLSTTLMRPCRWKAVRKQRHPPEQPTNGTFSEQRSVGVRQGCLLSPALFNTFLENIQQGPCITLGQPFPSPRPVSILRFAYDITQCSGRARKRFPLLTLAMQIKASCISVSISGVKRITFVFTLQIRPT